MSQSKLIAIAVMSCAILTSTVFAHHHANHPRSTKISNQVLKLEHLIKLKLAMMTSSNSRHRERIAYIESNSNSQQVNYGQPDYTFLNDPKFIGIHQARKELLAQQQHAGEFDCYPCDTTIRLSEVNLRK